MPFFTVNLPNYGPEFDTTAAWRSAFDQSVPKEARTAFLSALRDEVVELKQSHTKSWWDLKDYQAYLPDGAIVCIVMVSAYQYRGVFNALKAKGMACDFVLAGYSSGLYSEERLFYDGSSMACKLFMPERDVSKLASSRKPIVLADDAFVTRLTSIAIVHTLRRELDYKGDVYELTHTYGPRPWVDGLKIPETTESGYKRFMGIANGVDQTPLITELRTISRGFASRRSRISL